MTSALSTPSRCAITNTDPSTPADYLGTILTGVHQRLADTP